MYNLTVDTAHTFFVGEGQWLVHNACGDKLITLYHGSIADATDIYNNGLVINRPYSTYVAQDPKAALDAVTSRLRDFPHQVTDGGVIVSQVSKSKFDELLEAGDIRKNYYQGFYPYKLKTWEYLLDTPASKRLFNEGIQKLIRIR